MTSLTTAGDLRPPILDRIREVENQRRTRFRIQYWAVWIVLVGLLIFALWITDNIDTAWMAEWGPFILGGTWTTIWISVVAMVLAIVLALFGAIGRLSTNPIA